MDTLITASPEFFKKSPKEIQAFFQRAADFLIDRVGRENIVSAVVHMDEKTPHLHLTFVPLTKGQPPVCKGDYRQPGEFDKVAGRFSRLYGGEISPTWSVGRAPARQAGSISPPGFSNRRFPSPNRQEPLKPHWTAYPLNAGKKKKRSPLHAEKVVPADGELLRAVEKKYKVTINDLLAENEQLEARQSQRKGQDERYDGTGKAGKRVTQHSAAG